MDSSQTRSVSIASSSANSFTARITRHHKRAGNRLNRFFISEQFHRRRSKSPMASIRGSVSIASSSANSFTGHIGDRPLEIFLRVSIASSSANSFTESVRRLETAKLVRSQSLLHQRTVSQNNQIKCLSLRRLSSQSLLHQRTVSQLDLSGWGR